MMRAFCSICFLLCAFWLYGQENAPASAPVSARMIREEQWKTAEKGLDYSKDMPEKTKEVQTQRLPQVPEPRWAPGPGWELFLQILGVVAILGAIAYLVYKVAQSPQNKTIAADGVEITLENLEKYLHESDLDRFLREALASGNYALAIRLYYLQIIKRLTDREAIVWAQQKTNREYLREMREHPQYNTFRSLTRHYERIWYGNHPLDLPEFQLLEPEFRQFIQSV
jgi:hypothetical protein